MNHHDLTLSFSKLTEQDASLLSKLHPLIFAHQVWTEVDFQKLLALSTIEGLLVTTGKKTIGYIIWQKTFDEVEIITFGIIPSSQKKGYGQILYQQFESHVFLENCHKIILDVSSTNHKAIHFYERNGFIPFNTRKNYYIEAGNQVDAILMMKKL